MASAQQNRQFGPYLIQEKLGRGGVALVYKAVDQRSGQIVALKLLQPSWLEDAEMVMRFKKEADIVKTLHHPHIVALYDYGAVGGRLYLAMQYMARGSLARRFERPTSIGSQEVVRLLRGIASALDHAHRNGVVHRDLKLENILVNERGDTGLADFGIARVKGEQRLTITGGIVGTPMYMAPEQVRGSDSIDYRADLYALGIITYLLTVGRFPFGGDNLIAVLNQHVNAPVPLPSKIAPDIPRELDAVMVRALAKRPEERYASADAFIEAYATVMAGDKPRTTTVDIRSAHAATSEIVEEARPNPWKAQEPPPDPDDLVNQAASATDRDQAISLLKKALEIDPWHAQANRMLLRLQPRKPQMQAAVPAATPAAVHVAQPLPDLKRNVRQTESEKRAARKKSRRKWVLLLFLLLSTSCSMMTFSLIGMFPGLIGTVTQLLGGPAPVTEIDGVPIERIPNAAATIAPSQSDNGRGRNVDVLDHGYVHEYTFEAERFDEVAIYIQFMSVSAGNVARNVVVLRPDGSIADAACYSLGEAGILGGEGNVTLTCSIDVSGIWRVRVLGIEGQSIGAYFASVENLGQ